MTMKQTAAIIGVLVLAAALGSILFFTDHSKQQNVQAPGQEIVVPTKPAAITQSPAKVKEPESKPLVSPQPAENVKPVAAKQVSVPAATNSLPYASFTDFASRFNETAKLSDSSERWKAFRDMGINLSDEDFAKAETLVKNFQDRAPWENQRPDLVYQGTLLNIWLEKDPVSLANWANQLSKVPGLGAYSWSTTMIFNNGRYEYQTDATVMRGRDTKYLFSGIMRKWAEYDPQSALNWANNLPDSSQRESALKSVELGEKINTALTNPNPGEALEIISQWSDNELQEACGETGAIALRWLGMDSQAASDWIGQQTNGQVCLAMSVCYKTWADNDCPSATDWMKQAFDNPNLFYAKSESASAGTMYVSEILQSWHKQDPQGANAWLKQQQGRNDLTELQKRMVGAWSASLGKQ